MKPQTKGKIVFGVLGLICGVAISMLIGFGWGGWTTKGTTQKITAEAAICVAQFMKEPNHEEKLKEFGEVDYWKRPEFIQKGGWDKMPGQQKAGSSVAEACATALDVLIQK
jgi:hypothetical protein